MREPPSIDAWGRGGFRVSGVWRAGSLLILGDTPRDWRPMRIDDLQPSDFDSVFREGPATAEFILLGAGASAALPPQPVREAVKRAGLGFEFMATEAAARLHNVLAYEGRRFATALIAV